MVKLLRVDAVALGNNTVADVQNGVAIGTNSVTESAVGTSNIKDNTTDIPFQQFHMRFHTRFCCKLWYLMAVLVLVRYNNYTRQLQTSAGHVSSTSTDAINGSQLYDVALEAQKYNTLVDGSNTTVKV